MESPIKCSLEDCLSVENLQPDDLKDLLNVLQVRQTYYQEEAARMQSALLKVKILDASSKLEEYNKVLEELNQIEKKLGLEKLTPNGVVLAYADKLRKRNNYMAKIKTCLNMYFHLNEALLKKIKHLQSGYEQSEKTIKKIVGVSEDFKDMEQKISRYEKELTKLEKKYPWLKDEDCDLPPISKKLNLLIAARNKKQKLVQELTHYHGLKPDLQEASEQLSQVKTEYEEFSKKLLSEKD